MNSSEQTRREVSLLLMESLTGELTPPDVARLNQLMRSDASLTPFVADILSQEAWLYWTIARNRSGALRRDLAESLADSVHADAAPAQSSVAEPAIRPSASEPAERGARPSQRLALAAAVLVATGGILGSLLTWRVMDSRPQEQVVRIEDRSPDSTTPMYVARVVNATACRWSSDVRFPFENNGALRKGESLKLVEGIAEITLQWPQGAANLRVEGPAGIVLTADHGCSISHGKLTVDVITSDADAVFDVDTPNGLVTLPNGSSAGVIVAGRDVSVHAFQGDHISVNPWSSRGDRPPSLSLQAGEAITLVASLDGTMEVEHGESRASSFASQLSMYTDALNISDAYIQKVRSQKPLLYWRFDDPPSERPRVRNEMAERYAGTIFGSIQMRSRNGNQFVEFGASTQVDSTLPRIEANDFFGDEVKDDYSLEAWIKPNHYHLGTIVAFVPRDPVRGDTGILESPHGLLLEIGGPRTTETTIEQPGKIRYLHRSPPSGRMRGSTCFSSLSYEPRKWQHVVIVKQGPAMRIYLNGVMTGSGEDDTRMTTGLKLLVGQLDMWRSARMYVGQLDELAFYPIALSAEQILEHFNLVRSQPPPDSVEGKAAALPRPDAI